MLNNGILSKTLKTDSYRYIEDKNGWYDEYEYDVEIIFNITWMIRNYSFIYTIEMNGLYKSNHKVEWLMKMESIIWNGFYRKYYRLNDDRLTDQLIHDLVVIQRTRCEIHYPIH